MNANLRRDLLVAVGLIALGAATRLVPVHTSINTWNLNAIGAVALFSGFFFRDLRLAILTPLLAMAIADIDIGGYRWEMMLFNYAAMLVGVAFGPWIRAKYGVARVGVSTIAAAAIFFVGSNFGVWLCERPHTLTGITECYVDAWPFFRSGTLPGYLLFVAVLFGAYSLIVGRENVPSSANAKVTA